MNFEIGQIVGDYRILDILGRGGMGAVYKVRNMLTAREDAMKVILPDAAASVEIADRFLREIRIQASLQHPHIAAIRTAFRSGQNVLLIMELIEGSGLDVILRNGALPLGETFRITDDILGALSHAHSRGIVHRDIKPSNIIVTPRGAPKLMDFGIATVAGDTRITRSGVAIGSLAYMSPEQAMSQPLDERSDIYSLGITVYEALTGRRPFVGSGEYAMMNAHLHETPASPGAIVPSLPPAVCAVVMKSLAKAPEDRYQSAMAFQNAWREAFFGGVDNAETEILTEPLPPPPRMDPQDLARIESGLTRVLGPIAKSMVAKAALRHRTLDALSQELAAQIPHEADRAAFLKSCGGSTTATVSPPVSQIDEKTLKAARKALALSLGPIAAMLVSRAARRVHSMEELRDVLAAEIADEKERKAFLAALPGNS